MYDGIIASFIKELRNNSISVNSTDIILYVKEILWFFKERTVISLRNWASRFMQNGI